MLIDFIASALFIPFCFINSIFEKASKKLTVSMYLTSFTIILLGYHFSYITPLYLAITYLSMGACLILIAFLTKNRILNVLSAILGYIISIVLNNIILMILDVLFNISVEKIYGNMIYLISFYVFYFLMVFLLTKTLSKSIQKLDLQFLNKHKLSNLLIVELLVCISILLFNIAYGRVINYPSETIYFNCILFVLYFILSIVLVTKTVSATKQAILFEEKEKEYFELENYIKLINENNQQLRKFKHDYLNILFTLDLLIKERNIEELEKYYNNHILNTRQKLEISNEALAPLSYISDMPIRSLLFSKLNLAISKQIKVDVNINEHLSIPLLRPIEIARILGILLDNAIEAAIEGPEPEISFSCIKNNTYCEIIISNTFDSNTDISLEDIMLYGFSTKGPDKGIGLANVEEILNEYENILTNISVESNVFTFTLTIERGENI